MDLFNLLSTACGNLTGARNTKPHKLLFRCVYKLYETEFRKCLANKKQLMHQGFKILEFIAMEMVETVDATQFRVVSIERFPKLVG